MGGEIMAKTTIFISILYFAIVLAGTVYAESATEFNNKNVVHKGLGGESIAFPDVCKTPSPGGPIPIPYPNIGKSSDTAKGTKKVKMDGNPIMLKNSNSKTSTGDESGSSGNSATDTPTIKPKAPVDYSRPHRHR